MSSFPNTFQLVIQGSSPGNTGFKKPIDNVLNYGNDTGGSGAPSNIGFLTAWKTALEALFLACHDYSYILETYIVKDLQNPLFAQYEEDPGSHGTYNATPGAPAPTINAAFFYFKSITSGRSSHGGMHMGGLPLAGIQGNEFTGAFQTILNNWFTPFFAGFTDSLGFHWRPVILSRKASSLVPPPPVVNVVSLLVNSTRSFLDKDVGTMRRRKERTVR